MAAQPPNINQGLSFSYPTPPQEQHAGFNGNNDEKGPDEQNSAAATPTYSIFTPAQRWYIVAAASWAGLFSPLAANIYLPALNSLSSDLSVSIPLINLSITSYMIFQGLAPMFIGDFADTTGRRPAYALCFVIYIAANVGLALQNNYPALLVLRCLQSTGSSSTIALSYAVVSDVATTAQRGSYAGFVNAGVLLGPSLGPVIGGLLGESLGWRAIFWFLVLFAAAFTVQFLIFFPETARNVVGDGSIPPQKWNISAMALFRNNTTIQPSIGSQAGRPERPPIRFPNPIRTLSIVAQKETGIILLLNGLIFTGLFSIIASIPSLFHEIYGFGDLRIGLCYLPFGIGASCASATNGLVLDYNYKRIASQLGIQVVRTKQQDLRNFPIEKARLQIAIPFLYAGCLSVIAFGWVLHFATHIAGPLVVLFVSGVSVTGAFSAINTLIVDLNPNSAARATASNNLTRCLLGAGAAAVISPMTNALGRGWAFTIVAFIMASTGPALWAVVRVGPKWREERRIQTEARGLESGIRAKI